MIRTFAVMAAAVAVAPAFAAETAVFSNYNDNGWFNAFDSSTSADVRYGDSGWFGTGSDAGVPLTRIELGLVTTGGTFNGTTDINFSLHDGSPSGLVFGSGATLYSTTITGVDLSMADGSGPNFFTLSIDLPSVMSLGGFNNIGFAVGVENFSFDGELGFQCASTLAQPVGYYTNNASYYDGSSWSLFAFGSDVTYGVANFVTTIYTPTPGTAGVLALGGLVGMRRRR
ncbi:MAG: MYXO-CTERM sorting domain-containing protein [Phycisphaerales bacterium]